MRAQTGLFKGLNPTVTVASKLLVISFVMLCVILAEQAGAFFQHTSDAILSHFKWFYLSLVTGVLGLLIYLMLSRFGHIRLGADDEKPEFSFGSWIAMLFSGGMGIGLIFWSVAEPIWHYASNPFTADMTNESASMAMRLTLFHWGLHPWAIFTIVGLSLAYFAYRRGLPLSMRSILYPFIGEKIYGPIGHATDIVAVAITAFGVSQSLGLGVTQINTGFNQVFGLPVNFGVQALLIGLISLCAIVSVMSGVSRGIRRLSEWNMSLSILLLVAVLAIGSTSYLLNLMLESTGDYLQNLVGLSLWTDAQKDSGWQNWWTAFYWPWWMTWGPFVGLFIARVSRGRTIRELIAGTLLVPTMVTIVWMSVLGGSALKAEQQDRQAHQQQVEQGVLTGEAATFTGGDILTATKEETTAVMFTLLSKLDAGMIGQGLSILVCLLLATYFVTSADSGTLVLCTLCAEGHPEPPQGIRVLWGVLQALIAMALLYAGGLKTIQMASIAAGLPIAVFILVMSIALMRCVRQEGFTGLPRPVSAAPKPQARPKRDKGSTIGLNMGVSGPAVIHAKKAS